MVVVLIGSLLAEVVMLSAEDAEGTPVAALL
jgi:hypothetical protein